MSPQTPVKCLEGSSLRTGLVEDQTLSSVKTGLVKNHNPSSMEMGFIEGFHRESPEPITSSDEQTAFYRASVSSESSGFTQAKWHHFEETSKPKALSRPIPLLLPTICIPTKDMNVYGINAKGTPMSSDTNSARDFLSSRTDSSTESNFSVVGKLPLRLSLSELQSRKVESNTETEESTEKACESTSSMMAPFGDIQKKTLRKKKKHTSILQRLALLHEASLIDKDVSETTGSGDDSLLFPYLTPIFPTARLLNSDMSPVSRGAVSPFPLVQVPEKKENS